MEMEMENGKHMLFKFQFFKSDANMINEKLEEFFNKLDSAAKLNIFLGFVHRNFEFDQYLSFYVHENKTLLEK